MKHEKEKQSFKNVLRNSCFKNSLENTVAQFDLRSQSTLEKQKPLPSFSWIALLVY